MCSLQWAVLNSPFFFIHIMPQVVFPLLFYFLLFHISIFLYFSSLFSACQQGFFFHTWRHTKGNLIWNVTHNLAFHSRNFMNSYKIWKTTFCTQFGNISPIFLTIVIPDYNGIYIKKTQKNPKPESWTRNVFFSITLLFHQKKIKNKNQKKSED